MTQSSTPPIIAIIGCDGSGKTTVCLELERWLNSVHPTKLCHLGRQTGNIRRRLIKLPFLGKKLDKNITKTNKQAKSKKGPNALLALGIFIMSLRRVYRFYRMLSLRKQGFYILTDRFPQVAIIGGLDGPDLTTENPASSITRLLTKLERSLYNWMINHTPDLVIRLNVTVETAQQRKPDHRLESMIKKIGTLQQLTYNGAPIIDIDNNTQPIEETINQAKKAIAKKLNIAS
ncbi:nucleoside triphosphate hydrolase [Commensalibacter melissae]|uniref:Nucleoside triphosphate hydrolase n=1 Tax=Commensalibacter melissae TaxID=2070537 RepID=A0A318MVL5_9PROT|nr:nucleoside triphosphate hydrolase [Commensalibacter melissae]PXY99719.1 nucleoside triphosphate hydrolase [Commensalibacter melissae]QGT67995.1 nucleoside triphosphate hydrolase [Commensalibacter melissae]